MRCSLFGVNIPVFFLSLIVATLVWYTFTMRDRVDIHLELRVDYKNIPHNLIVTDGLLHKITVRLRGPEALFQNPPQGSLVHVVDLAGLHRGENTIPFPVPRMDGALRAFEVHEITPSRIIITADIVQEQNMNLDVKIVSPLHSSSMQVTDVYAKPDNVLVRGPAGLLETMSSIPVTVRINPDDEPGIHTQTIVLDTPSQVITTPTVIEVQYRVLSGREHLQIKRAIRINAKESLEFVVEPSILTFEVEVPKALSHNAQYVRQAIVTVTPPPLNAGESAIAPIRVTLPEGMTVLSGFPKEVRVTKIY